MIHPVFHLDLTLPEPELNLALDEALLHWAEACPGRQVLRTWRPSRPFVVVGYANEAAREASLPACRQHGVPVLRRCTGGGTVLQGPGCFNYSLVLDVDSHPGLESVSGSNRYILERHRAVLESLLGRPVSIQGHTDLAVDGRKCSGNAQRRGRRRLLFHGTFLLEVDLELMREVLPPPSRQPDYRQGRSHEAFLTSLGVPAHRVRDGLRQAWDAHEALEDWPEAEAKELAASAYSRADWNFKR